MQMKIVSKMALAIALGGMAVAAPAFAKKEEKPAAAASAEKATPAVQKAAFDAQKAADAGDIATALTNYNTAKAAMVNNTDKFMVGRVGYQIFQKNKDEALFSEVVDMMLSSGLASADAQKQLYFAQGQIAYNKKDYAKALTAFQGAEKAGSTDPDLVPLIVESTALQGRTLDALKTLNDEATKRTAAGQPVPPEWYQRGVSIGYKNKSPSDQAAINQLTLELCLKWVASAPQPQYWNGALEVYAQQFKLDNEGRLEMLRLLRAVGGLEGGDDYREYADDVYLRFPNEAMTVLQEGAAKGKVSLTGKNDATDVMGIVKGKVVADKASLPGADKASRAAATGKAALSTADAYVGYGDYAKAVDLYKVALAKGGVDAGTVNLHMGWALALSGDNAGAKAAFQAVTGVRKPIADFWLIHLDHPTVPNVVAAK
jgi:tetratricopeptide (TPR) repeat protein